MKNKLGKEAIKIVAHVLEKSKCLEYLDLSKNEMGVSGGQALGQALKVNRSLKYLNLFNNKIGYDGAVSLGEGLKTNNVIEFLDVGHNRIRDKGLRKISQGLASNKDSQIKVLGLKFNHLTEEGVKDLLLAVFDKEPFKSKLQEIFIYNNNIDEDDLFTLKKLCEDKSNFIWFTVQN